MYRFMSRCNIVVFLLAASLTLGGVATGHAEGKILIAVGGLAKQIHLPEVLCEKLGYFKQQGLDVEYVNIGNSGVNAENQLIAGAVQAASSSYDHTISLQSKGKYITTIVQFMAAPGEAELVPTRFAEQIKKLSDLKGHTLGVSGLGGMTDYLSRSLALRGGLAPGDITVLGIGADSTFIAAMNQGEVQAGMVTDLTVTRMLSAHEAVLLADLRTPAPTLAALGAPYVGDSLYVSEAWLKTHKDQAQHLANAFVMTMKWMATHSAEEITNMVPQDYYEGNRALYVAALAQNKSMFTPDGRMPEGAPQAVLKVLSAFNPNIDAKKIDLSRTYDPEFVDAARRGTTLRN
jgi:NitT/TauT family transport system substrate-binding protein